MKPSPRFSDDITPFQKKVYLACAKVPKGKVTTYGEIAKGIRSGSRAVGNALHKNPYAPAVPCHRVVKSDGKVGGFASGSEKKEALLRKEGIQIEDGKIKGFKDVFYKFTSSS